MYLSRCGTRRIGSWRRTECSARRWTGPTWKGTGSGIAGGKDLPGEGQGQVKEVDRAYLERDRLSYSRWTRPTWRETGSGIAGGQGLPGEGQAPV
jgi:hypothetical protein